MGRDVKMRLDAADLVLRTGLRPRPWCDHIRELDGVVGESRASIAWMGDRAWCEGATYIDY